MTRRRNSSWWLALTAMAACGNGPASPASPDRIRVPSHDEVELVESWPRETLLDSPEVRDAADVWPELIDEARTSIQLEQFYASTSPNSRMIAVMNALERATKRGVRVQFLADTLFAKEYAESLNDLRTRGIEVRTLNSRASFGGVQHAKTFVIDSRVAFVGSQNFDWRALEHIQEMGAVVRSEAIARALGQLFEHDWALAQPDALSGSAQVAPLYPFAETRTTQGDRMMVLASPRGWLPAQLNWDLPTLVSYIDKASHQLDLQVLTYSTVARDKSRFFELHHALRRAAARNVKLRVLVSHWCTKEGTSSLASISDLAGVENIEVRVLTIPESAEGPIAFARVAHSKYMTIDAGLAWVGTSNWEGDYFYKSRNVSLFFEGPAVASTLARVFERAWKSPYATPLRPPVAVVR